MGQISSKCFEDGSSSSILNENDSITIESFTPPRIVNKINYTNDSNIYSYRFTTCLRNTDTISPRNSLLKTLPCKFPNISTNPRLSIETTNLEKTCINYRSNNNNNNTNDTNDADNNNKRYKILFDFVAEKSEELSVLANQIVEIISINEDSTNSSQPKDCRDWSYVKLVHTDDRGIKYDNTGYVRQIFLFYKY
jgi:hypothetical protein